MAADVLHGAPVTGRPESAVAELLQDELGRFESAAGRPAGDQPVRPGVAALDARAPDRPAQRDPPGGWTASRPSRCAPTATSSWTCPPSRWSPRWTRAGWSGSCATCSERIEHRRPAGRCRLPESAPAAPRARSRCRAGAQDPLHPARSTSATTGSAAVQLDVAAVRAADRGGWRPPPGGSRCAGRRLGVPARNAGVYRLISSRSASSDSNRPSSSCRGARRTGRLGGEPVNAPVQHVGAIGSWFTGYAARARRPR